MPEGEQFDEVPIPIMNGRFLVFLRKKNVCNCGLTRLDEHFIREYVLGLASVAFSKKTVNRAQVGLLKLSGECFEYFRVGLAEWRRIRSKSNQVPAKILTAWKPVRMACPSAEDEHTILVNHSQKGS